MLDSMSTPHEEPKAPSRRLVYTLLLTSSVMLVELIGGTLSGSLSLLADAGHMFTDAIALGLAALASVWSRKPGKAHHTFGYHRLEIFAALINGLALVVVSGSIIQTAINRWMVNQEVHLPIMGGVALVGLCANLLWLWLLRKSRWLMFLKSR